MYCNVVINNNSMFIENTYTYKIPPDVSTDELLGKRVVVAFGNNIEIGLVISITETVEGDFQEFKFINSVIDDYPMVTNDVITLLINLSIKTGDTISRYLNSMFPINLNLEEQKKYKVNNIDNIDLVLRTLLPNGEFEIDGVLAEYEKDIAKHVNVGDITCVINFRKKYDYKYTDCIFVVDEKPCNINEKQQEILNYLKKNQNKYIPVKTLVNKCGFSRSSINTLIKKSVLEKKFLQILPAINSSIQPTKSAVVKRKNRIIHLVDTIDKLDAMAEIVKDTLDLNRNVLILFPDIISLESAADYIEELFYEGVGSYHSKISGRNKFELISKLNNNEIRILLGVGGASLAPLKNIGAIILYDSSDNRYLKSQYNFYDIKSVASMRAKENLASLFHITSSPSIVEYFEKTNNENWEYQKYKNNLLFQKTIVNMKGELYKGNNQIFSLDLIKKLNENILDYQTSFLLVNVLGDNSALKCRGCGRTTTCPHCGTNLTLSDAKHKLMCSSCRFEIKYDEKCIYCGSSKIRKMKLGIKDVFDYTKLQFKKASILMLTMEEMTSVSKIRKLKREIKLNKYDIIIGTKDIASLLQNIDIKLAVLVMTDITLNVNSYKASELAFNEVLAASSVLNNEASKELLIQTYDPDNKVIKYAVNGDYEGYYTGELMYRKISNNPPYCKLAYLTIRISEKKYKQLRNNIELYVNNYFKDDSYFGPNIDFRSSSSMLLIKYTMKVDSIEKVVDFKNTLSSAFGSGSMFITVEYE